MPPPTTTTRSGLNPMSDIRKLRGSDYPVRRASPLCGRLPPIIANRVVLSRPANNQSIDIRGT